MSGFRARWAELKKEGWSSKRPAGLSVDFTYLKPGKTKKDTRGVDVFVGEEELMRYLDRIDLGKTLNYFASHNDSLTCYIETEKAAKEAQQPTLPEAAFATTAECVEPQEDVDATSSGIVMLGLEYTRYSAG